MRQWFKMVALGAIAALAVAVPGAAVGYEGDDAPNATTERAAEQVMEQTQSRFGQPHDAAPGTMDQTQERNRSQLRDGSGEDCVNDCDGIRTRDQARERDQARDRTGEDCVDDCDGTRTRDRDQARDGTGDDCVAGCDGLRLRDRDQLRHELQDSEAGCRAAWRFNHRYGFSTHVAV